MTTTERITEFAIETSFKDIPSGVIHDTKRIILDGIGCVLGGFGIKDCGEKISSVVSDLGGPKESTVIGKWDRLSCAGATYANAKLGNLMDMDDVFLNIGHQSPMVLYPALAIGERERSEGKDLLAAVAIGYDVSSRVVLAIGTLFDLVDGRVEEAQVTGFGQGVFGGAVSAGRLLNLDERQMRNALGMAGLYTPVPLAYKSITDMSMSKYQLEWAALGAVFAALLAKKNFTGPQTMLDDSLYAQALGKKTYLKDRVEAELGTRWYIRETSIKPYPTCRHTQYVLDLVSQLVRENHLQPESISRITLRGLGNYQQPPWNNYAPQSEFELQFSVPYAVALAAHQIKPGPQWFNPGLLQDARLKKFVQKIQIEPEPQIADLIRKALPLPALEIPTTVIIATLQGEYTATTTKAKGDGFTEARLSDDELIEKFKENASPILSERHREAIIDRVMNLEKMKDVRELFRF